MTFPPTSDYDYKYTTYSSTFTPDQLSIALNLGHAGLNIVGAVPNLLNVTVLILLVRRYGCTKNAYGLFLAAGLFELGMNILWSIYQLTVYVRKGSPLPISSDPLLYDSNFQYLLINLTPHFLSFLSTASEFVILAMAVISLIGIGLKQFKSWISLSAVIAVIIGALVVSVALSLPGWLLTKLIAWKDRHEISSPDFYGSYVFEYLRAYGIITVYMPYGLTLLLIILLTWATREYSLEEEYHTVVVILTAVLAWKLICETPLILIQALIRWAYLPTANLFTWLEIARYSLVLEYSLKGLIYFSFNSLYRQTALGKAQSVPAAATAAPTAAPQDQGMYSFYT
ncbi:hypothetical protein EB796_021443 [Bugula neritina]|uniref:Uncharacterized protein n=1 Tax=Bugula neritina TaxID=10212 RepID=A0A7J7J3N3_BUGNE|nr:hypothetical protein EB796_021443 [Bugula neritina]